MSETESKPSGNGDVGDQPPEPSAPSAKTVEGSETKSVVETPSPAERIKVDFYQTDSDVVINILAKNIKKDDVQVDFQKDKIQVKFAMPSGETYERTLNLFKSINQEACTMKVMSTKLELRLKKLDASSWQSLEAVNIPVATVPKYPSSSKNKTDWDKLDKELSKEKDEDADVNSLFSKIFESGDENTKKAMMKSMQESGGTVLSTNWDEVGKKRVEISPPDGMEFKKWDS